MNCTIFDGPFTCMCLLWIAFLSCSHFVCSQMRILRRFKCLHRLAFDTSRCPRATGEPNKICFGPLLSLYRIWFGCLKTPIGLSFCFLHLLGCALIVNICVPDCFGPECFGPDICAWLRLLCTWMLRTEYLRLTAIVVKGIWDCYIKLLCNSLI